MINKYGSCDHEKTLISHLCWIKCFYGGALCVGLKGRMTEAALYWKTGLYELIGLYKREKRLLVRDGDDEFNERNFDGGKSRQRVSVKDLPYWT